MKNCEFVETSLSTFIDGELDQAELAPTIDHLMECADCRAFYRDARALDAMVLDATVDGSIASPSDEIWSRIAGRSALGTTSPRRRGASWTAWGALAAGLLLVAVGLWATPRFMGGRVTPLPATAAPIVVVGTGEGRMSDERFVELTTELLRSAPRYHERMLQVMELVTTPMIEPEGSNERLLDDLREPSRRQNSEGRDLTFDASLSGGQS